ncbi:MAG: O-antigen ligase family protein [Candidatus Yanofskybacteria bacterium]|nr:O-antigen ligase family protein [Candidatus Yanofskybacteria bacterium]
MSKFLNIIFVIHLLVIGLVITGILPRAVVPFWTIALTVQVLLVSLEDSTTFFVRSIPFFIAIPITAGFDSLNMWRILSGLIFIKWALSHVRHRMSYMYDMRCRTVCLLLAGLLLLAILSATQAQNYILSAKRIIYFINLSLIGIVIYDLVRKNQDFSRRLIKNIAIPTIIVVLLGMVQLAMTYFMDIFRFVDFWGGVVERNMYGNVWAETAIKANTWFAYFGDQLSLRMFSIFPDSHSFPIFLLLGLPAVMAIALKKVVGKGIGFKTMLKTRASMLVIFTPIIFLALILTGTRGIWVAGVMSAILAIFLIFRLRKTHVALRRPYIEFGYISSYLAIFFLLFGVAYYIIASDQFMAEKNSTGMLAKRARSVIDISETSNARRIEIWKDSLRSIIKHPLLGVGIGNFPVVVREDLARVKAGSSAHNLYLNIAAEMGIPALILALWFLWLLLKKLYNNFLKPVTSYQLPITIYFGSLLIFLPWVLVYSLTDVAIFDERAFLLFVTTIALVLAQKENGRAAE